VRASASASFRAGITIEIIGDPLRGRAGPQTTEGAPAFRRDTRGLIVS
jgi:hypothetical protein